MKENIVVQLIDEMEKVYPDATCELTYSNIFELLIAVMLSARTTDKSVNKVTPTLFQKYPTPQHFLQVEQNELENDINTIGLYKSKAKHIQQCCYQLIHLFNGEVPSTYEELITLSGVGRKTANVVLSVGFNIPAIAVDTHVEKVSKCLSLIDESATPLQVEEFLMDKVPKERWSKTHHLLIFWGRYQCLRSKKNKHCAVCQKLLKKIDNLEIN